MDPDVVPISETLPSVTNAERALKSAHSNDWIIIAVVAVVWIILLIALGVYMDRGASAG